jgi:putative addiction module CopG family antidote
MNDVESIEQFVKFQLSSGRYNSRDELVFEALKLLQEYESELDHVALHLQEPVNQWKTGLPGKQLDLQAIFDRAEKVNK